MRFLQTVFYTFFPKVLQGRFVQELFYVGGRFRFLVTLKFDSWRHYMGNQLQVILRGSKTGLKKVASDRLKNDHKNEFERFEI